MAQNDQNYMKRGEIYFLEIFLNFRLRILGRFEDHQAPATGAHRCPPANTYKHRWAP